MSTKKILFVPALVCVGLLAEPEINFTVHQTSTQNQPNTVHLFSHGLGATQQQGITIFSRLERKTLQGLSIINKHWIIDEPLALFDFPDAKGDNKEYHRKLVTLGQEADINQLAAAYQKTCTLFPAKDIILSGVSRGAATIINFVALQKPQQVKAIILESPFDKLSSIVKHLLARFHIHWFPFSKRIAYKVSQRHFPNVRIDGIFPINVIHEMPATIPILLIHAKTDKVIPINSTRRLYIKLKEAGHQDVYLAELSSGSHGKLLLGNDADFYHFVVHAFYKKYDLTHDVESARQGDNLLTICQPSIDEIKKRIKRKRSLEQDMYDDDDGEDEYIDDDDEETDEQI
jgi:predicted esterase